MLISRISLLLLLTVALPSFAEEGHVAATAPAEAHVGTNDAEKINSDFENTKKSLMEEEEKQRKILSSLFDINRKMKKIVNEKSDLIQEKLVVESNTKVLAKKIQDMDLKIKQQKALLRERLVAIYKLGGQGLARILLSAGNSQELEQNLKIMGLVAKRDLALIQDYKLNMKEYNEKKNRFIKRLAQIKKIEDGIRSNEEKLSLENASKNRILDGIRKSKKYALNKIHVLRERSLQMNLGEDSGILDLLFRPSFFEQKGLLPRPVNGAVIAPFGLVKYENNQVAFSRKGVVFKAVNNENVKSIFDGKIAFAGLVSGYGQTVIVDHGDHYYSVYGYAKEILVKEGDEIKQGQNIALAGLADLSDIRTQALLAGDQISDGLYFEIRHFSEPNDPVNWLKGTAL